MPPLYGGAEPTQGAQAPPRRLPKRLKIEVCTSYLYLHTPIPRGLTCVDPVLKAA